MFGIPYVDATLEIIGVVATAGVLVWAAATAGVILVFSKKEKRKVKR